MTERTIVVGASQAGERADRIISMALDIPRSECRAAFDDGMVTVGGSAIKPSYRAVVGEELVVVLADRMATVDPDPDVSFTVVHEDPHLLVIDKPIGVVVHPTSPHSEGTLVHGLVHRFPDVVGVGEEPRWGIVHRLDRDTSGLLLVARTNEAHAALRAAIARREVGRDYLALVRGAFDAARGTIDAPIGRDRRNPMRMRVSREGRHAVTHYRRTAQWDDPDCTLLSVSLETGRTHQIRVHLAAIDRPIIGDQAYGVTGGPADPGRPWLHARRLAFTHPITGEEIVVTARLPRDLTDSLSAIGDPTSGTLREIDPGGRPSP